MSNLAKKDNPGILITGANGQLGSELAAILNNGYFSGLFDNISLFFTDQSELDITNRDEVISFVSGNAIDVVINCAAYTAVDKAEDEPEVCMAVNRDAPANLAAAAKASNALLIHISTDYVFDGRGPLPYNEDDLRAPSSIYGKSKEAGEIALEESGARFLIIRTSWLYSRFGNNFVKTIARLANEKDKLEVVYDQIGTPTCAQDLANAILVICRDYLLWSTTRDSFPYGIYHYSNEGVCSWYDFAVEIVRLSGSKCVVEPVLSEHFPSRAKRPPYSVLDKQKIKKTFGLKIPHWKLSLEVSSGEYLSSNKIVRP